MSDFTAVIEIPALLAPIAADQPHGHDMRREFDPASPYQRLRAARQDAREAERRNATAEAGKQGPPPDWDAVADAAIDLLSNHSKDMEAAAWLLEALLRRDGLPGLTAGAAVIAGLARDFWDGLYPVPADDEQDEDVAEVRLRTLAGLVSGPRATLLPPLRLLPLFARADDAPVTLTDYDNSVLIMRLEEEQQRARIADGALTAAALDDLAVADPAGLTRLARDAAAALASWDALDQALAAKAGSAKPSLAAVRELLARIDALAKRLAPADATTPPPPEPADAATGRPAPSTARAATGGEAGPIATRDDALRRLNEVADWFRRNEPQSPLSYTLSEAVRRGRMSLPDLLSEVVSDYGTRASILTALGIKPPPEE